MQPDVRVQVTQLMALAFLPVAIVRLTFATLEQQANDILRPLFQYFRQEWLTAKTTPAVEYAQTTTARGGMSASVTPLANTIQIFGNSWSTF